MKLLIFESHPVQYHAPVYQELNRICRVLGQYSLKVYYATDISLRGYIDEGFRHQVAWDEPLLSGYENVVMHNERGQPLKGFFSLTGRRIWQTLQQEKPDAVMLTNLAYEFDWIVYLSANLLNIPIWIRTETQDSAFQRSKFKTWLRSLIYRCIYSRINKSLTIGKLNAEHFTKHGVNISNQVFSPYCVEDHFSKLSEDNKKSIRESRRSQLGFAPNLTILMFCGKLQPKKQPEILLKALMAMTEQEQCRYGILYVGTGELETEIIELSQQIPKVKVQLVGFKNQTELPAYYLAADVIILPSRQMGETWGLVVNEALLAERQVIISPYVGCGADFKVLPSVHIFDGSVEGLVNTLQTLPASSITTRQLEFMQAYSIQAAAAGIALAMGMT